MLFQRAVYPESQFEKKSQYGATMMVTKDQQLRDYLQNVLQQVEVWARQGDLQQLVLVITSVQTQEPLERWVFNVETARDEGGRVVEEPAQTDDKELKREIGAIIRQITSSVTFLPYLEERCSFDLLVYTSGGAEVPITWENSDPRHIRNAQKVQLRGFNTGIHQVGTSVAYRGDD